MSNIEWTEATWNPIVGCSVVSPGCTNCYAMTMAARLEAMGTLPHYAGTTQKTKAGPVWTGKLALAPEATLLAPLRRRKPTVYFVNSMGDLFHDDVPDAWIDRVFAVMALTPQHTYQVLTKRSARMRAYLTQLDQEPALDTARRISRAWPDARIAVPAEGITFPLRNVWLGASAEDQRRADERIPDLLATPAAIRFVSAEPLLGAIDFNSLRMDGMAEGGDAWLTGALSGLDPAPRYQGAKIDWIIAGGESGKGARHMEDAWAESIVEQCSAAGTAVFVKQMGGPVKARMRPIPERLMVRQFPGERRNIDAEG